MTVDFGQMPVWFKQIHLFYQENLRKDQGSIKVSVIAPYK